MFGVKMEIECTDLLQAAGRGARRTLAFILCGKLICGQTARVTNKMDACHPRLTIHTHTHTHNTHTHTHTHTLMLVFYMSVCAAAVLHLTGVTEEPDNQSLFQTAQRSEVVHTEFIQYSLCMNEVKTSEGC